MIINGTYKNKNLHLFIFMHLYYILLLHENNGIYITQTTQISYSVFIIGLFHKPDDFYFSIALLCF
ncbi:hypothetical protein BANRA_03689 [Escherichia coli]|nr:hypothetical protein BANRA_03689 [Escherichia coli]